MNVPPVEGQGGPSMGEALGGALELGGELEISTGAELNEDSSATPPGSVVDSAFDPATFDWANATEDQVPEHLRFVLGLNRHWQSTADRRVAEEQGRLRATEQGLRDEMAQLKAQIEGDGQAGQATDGEPATPSTEFVDVEWARDFLSKQGVTDAEEQGRYMAFMNLAKAVSDRGQSASEQRISAQLEEIKQAMTQQQEQVQQASQEAKLTEARASLDEAINEFGADEVGKVYQTLVNMYGQAGADGKPMSFSQAYRLLKGMPASEPTATPAARPVGTRRGSPMVGVGGKRPAQASLPAELSDEQAVSEIDKRLAQGE